MITQRNGFALITVLWVMVGVAALALIAGMTGRSALASARNRKAYTEAQWKADGCVERARAAIHSVITQVQPDAVIATWDSLDRVIASSPFVSRTGCNVSMRASGAILDINTADQEQLLRFFNALGISSARSDSLADAMLDWRDPDTDTRQFGAERGWYEYASRLLPRDRLFANPKELLRVRGFENFGDTLRLMNIDGDRMPLSHTPLEVLASLPGMSTQVLARIADIRRQKSRVSELLVLTSGLSQDAQTQMMTHYSELARRTTPEPDAWIVTARAEAGDPAVGAEIELRLARAGTRVAILRRR